VFIVRGMLARGDPYRLISFRSSVSLPKRRAVPGSVLRGLAALSLVLLRVVAHAESLGLSLLLSHHILLQLLSAHVLKRGVLLLLMLHLLLCLMIVQVLLCERRRGLMVHSVSGLAERRSRSTLASG